MGLLNEGAKRVLLASNEYLTNSDEQSTRTHSVAAAINELRAAAQEIAMNANDTSQQTTAARQKDEDGRQVVERTIEVMNQLSTKISASCVNIEVLNSKTVNIGKRTPNTPCFFLWYGSPFSPLQALQKAWAILG